MQTAIDTRGAELDARPTAPRALNIFLSHRTETKGADAQRLARILESTARTGLHVFVSPNIGAGTRWSDEVYQELRQADLLILLFTDPEEGMYWPLYESGFFAAVRELERPAGAPECRLMCLMPEGLEAPGPLQEWQNVDSSPERLKTMLRAIFDNEALRVYPELFDERNVDLLDRLVEDIRTIVGPGPFRKSTMPRVRITIRGAGLGLLAQGRIDPDAELAGDVRALNRLGLDGVTGGFRWKDVVERLDSPELAGLLEFHLAHTLATGLGKAQARCTVPPFTRGQDKVDVPETWSLVLTQVEAHGINDVQFDEGRIDAGDYVRFELGLGRTWSNHGKSPASGDAKATVVQLLASAWHCKSRVCDKRLRHLKNLESSGPDPERIARALNETMLDMQWVLLDCCNRGLLYPDVASSAFEGTESEEPIRSIVDSREGTWARAWPALGEAVARNDLRAAIETLEEIGRMSDSVFSMSARRLCELVDEK